VSNLEKDKKENTEKIGKISERIKNIELSKEEIGEFEKDIQEDVQNLKYYTLLSDIFGLEGVQTKIISKYLPLLNVYIKEFLDILSEGKLNVSMEVNSRSKIDMVVDGGTAPTFDMLSGGEKMMVRLAVDIGLALLSFCRSAQKPEMICLDEILGPLDNNKTKAVFKMLEVLKDKFSRVLIITHKSDIQELIQTNIVVEKSSVNMGLSEIKKVV
jgi:DNA repair exonuclease SbcCD ATPase subunit